MNENTAPRLTAEELRTIKKLSLKTENLLASDFILIGRYMDTLGYIGLTANRGIIAYREVKTNKILWAVLDLDPSFDMKIEDLFSSTLGLFCRDAVSEMQKGEMPWKRMWYELNLIVELALLSGVE